MGAHRAHVVGEDFSQLVVGHLAEIGRLAAEAGDAGDGVARRTAGGFHARRHFGVERLRLRLVDQHHGALVEAVGGQEGVVGRGYYVDDGVADRGDVVEVWHYRAFRRRRRGRGLQKIGVRGNVGDRR